MGGPAAGFPGEIGAAIPTPPPQAAMPPPPPPPASGFNPSYAVLHDYGSSPANSPNTFIPYNALVFPDGTVRYRNPDNPYGTQAPHAYQLNPNSVGLAYAG